VDDRTSVFVILVAETCDTARLAHLPVRMLLADGTPVEGHPAARLVDDDGLGEGLVEVAGVVVPLSQIAEISVHCP
jgi:hypothetical protein